MIASTSTIGNSQVNPSVIVTGANFKAGLTAADFTFGGSGTGLATPTAVRNSATQVTISFVGAAAAGTVTVQAKTSAFDPAAAQASNTLTFTVAAAATGLLEAVGTFLQVEGEGSQGVNLFLGRMPDAPDVCVCVYESAGSLPEMTFGAAGVAIDRPILQVMCRAGRDDYPAARDKAASIRTRLSALANTTLSGIKVMRIEPTGSVNPIGPDEKDRPLVSLNFQAMILP